MSKSRHFAQINSLRIKTLIKIIVSILTIGYLLFFVYQNWSEIPALIRKISQFEESRWAITVIIMCNLGSWILASAQFHIPLRRKNVDIGYMENLALFIAGVLLNYTPHKAGSIFRLYYLKKWYGVSYARFLGLQTARTISMFGVAGFIGLIAVAVEYLQHGEYSLEITLIMVLMFVAGVFPFIFKAPDFLYGDSPLLRFLHDLYDGIGSLKTDKKLAMSFLALILMQFLVLYVQYRVLFEITGYDAAIVTYLILIPVILLLSMVSVTPGNLGLRELVTASVLTLTAGEFDLAMLVGLVDRGALLLSTVFFGVLSLSYVYLKRRRPAGA